MNDPDRIQRDKATILAIIKYALITALIVGVLYLGLQLFMILVPFAIGFILARVSIALADRLNRHRFKRSRKAVAAVPAKDHAANQPTDQEADQAACRQWPEHTHTSVVIYALLVILIFLLVAAVIVISVSQIRALAEYLPTLVREGSFVEQVLALIAGISNRLGGLFDESTLSQIEAELMGLQQQLIHAIPNIATWILNAVGVFIGALPVIFFSIIVMIMSGYYFISDSGSVLSFIDRNVPHKAFREKTGRLIRSLSTTLFRVIGGYLLLLIITFLAVLAGLLIIRMPYAVVFALIAAIVDFLPILGLSATLIPISIYMFINGNIWSGFGALILYAAMSFLRRVIEPPILGNAMNLHPMATLFAMIVGIGIYGLLGILLGPVILVIVKEVLTLYGFDIKLRKIFAEVLSKLND